MPRAARSGKAAGLCLLCLLCLSGPTSPGCGASGSGTPRAAGIPEAASARREAVVALGGQLFEAFRAGQPRAALAPASDLDDLLSPAGRFRIERSRARLTDTAIEARGAARAWQGARFAGVCAQGAQLEPAARGLGLREPAWVMKRLLIVGQVGNTRVAAWLGGAFVYTQAGFRALSLDRIETPRGNHADLELAPCDVEWGIR